MNWERLHHLFDGDEELIQKFVEVFRAEMPRLSAQLEQAVRSENWEEVSNTAHTMKSQLAYAGLDQLAHVALQIEKSAERRTDLESIPGWVEELVEELRR